MYKKVTVIMGSDSDLLIVKGAISSLNDARINNGHTEWRFRL